MDSFYILGTQLKSTSIYAPPIGLRTPIKNNINDAKNLIQGDFEGIMFPVIFKQGSYGGKQLHDVIDTTYSSLYLISDNMRNILTKNGVTGWKTFPIKIYDKKNNEIPDYWGFSITGRCDSEVRYRKDSIIEKQLVPNAPFSKYYKGLNIDFTKWDGTDFFIAKHYLRPIISQKAREILVKYNLTNISATNINDIEKSDFNVKEEDLI